MNRRDLFEAIGTVAFVAGVAFIVAFLWVIL